MQQRLIYLVDQRPHLIPRPGLATILNQFLDRRLLRLTLQGGIDRQPMLRTDRGGEGQRHRRDRIALGYQKICLLRQRVLGCPDAGACLGCQRDDAHGSHDAIGAKASSIARSQWCVCCGQKAQDRPRRAPG
jgi:hypothetical protein